MLKSVIIFIDKDATSICCGVKYKKFMYASSIEIKSWPQIVK